VSMYEFVALSGDQTSFISFMLFLCFFLSLVLLCLFWCFVVFVKLLVFVVVLVVGVWNGKWELRVVFMVCVKGQDH
jgi:hypothetical protein